MSCYFTDRRCPECGSPLLTNGRFVWCSLVGSARPDGTRAAGCDYGIRERVKVEDAPAATDPDNTNAELTGGPIP